VGVKDGYVPMRMPGEQAYSDHAHFLEPTKESTRMWGDTASISFVPTSAELLILPTQQLVHVMRKRPTTFYVALVVALGAGWNGEGALTIVANYFAGIGQAKANIQKTFQIATPASNVQPINDVSPIPATALQIGITVILPNILQLNTPHDLQITALCAPLYA
jgi:hypothetical protein